METKHNKKPKKIYEDNPIPFELPSTEKAETFPEFLDKSFKELEPLENYIKSQIRKNSANQQC